MLGPIRTAPGAVMHNLLPSVLPAVKNLLTHLPITQKPDQINEPKTGPDTAHVHSTTTSGSPSTSARMFTLFGTPRTDRFVGPTALHYVIRRNICGISKKAPPGKTMTEPYAAAIKSLEPDFLKLGFMKTHEEEFLTIFSDGLCKVAIRREPGQPQNEYFIDRNNFAHSIRRLKYQFNTDAENQQEAQARKAIVEKYGLLNDDTPTPIKLKGLRACAVFDLAQSIKFLATHQEELCKLVHPSEEMLAGAETYTIKPPETA